MLTKFCYLGAEDQGVVDEKGAVSLASAASCWKLLFLWGMGMPRSIRLNVLLGWTQDVTSHKNFVNKLCLPKVWTCSMSRGPCSKPFFGGHVVFWDFRLFEDFEGFLFGRKTANKSPRKRWKGTISIRGDSGWLFGFIWGDIMQQCNNTIFILDSQELASPNIFQLASLKFSWLQPQKPSCLGVMK